MSVPVISAVEFSARSEDASKPLLVLGPSLGTSSTALWSGSAAYLSDEFEVIGWDLPGHGSSAPATESFSMGELAQAVIVLVDRVQQGRGDAGAPFYYAGVSVGGSVGLMLMLDFPDRVAKAAVICSGAKISEPDAWQERSETVRASGTPTMVTGSAQRWFAPGFIEKDPQTSTSLLHSLQNADRFSYAWVSEALAGFDVRDRLGEIAVPVLAIAGRHDTVTPMRFAEEVAAGVQQGRAVELDNAAHLAPAEDPQRVAGLLRGFFAGNTAPDRQGTPEAKGAAS